MRQSLRLVRPIFAIFTLAWSLAAASTAHAQITIGGTDGNNVFPFGINTYVGEYQQIYAGSAFSGPTTISSIAFSSENGFSPATRTDNITLSLSNTTATPGAPGTNYAGNKGSNFTTVFNNSLTFTSTQNNTFDLVIPITPFTYDPSMGNLLLDVVVNSSTGNNVVFQFGSDTRTGRIYNSNGNGAATSDPNVGLLTRFGTQSAVPEPGTLALLTGMGVTGSLLVVRRLRQRKN